MIYTAPQLLLAPAITKLKFSKACIGHLLTNQQMELGAAERGGQLFAVFQGATMQLELATGPHRGARSGRFWFRGNRRREREEIQNQFRLGRHYVGDWHSHPEPTPTPSSLDLRTQRSLAAKSNYELHGLLMVIVGQNNFPSGLCAYFVDRQGAAVQLRPQGYVKGGSTKYTRRVN